MVTWWHVQRFSIRPEEYRISIIVISCSDGVSIFVVALRDDPALFVVDKFVLVFLVVEQRTVISVGFWNSEFVEGDLQQVLVVVEQLVHHLSVLVVHCGQKVAAGSDLNRHHLTVLVHHSQLCRPVWVYDLCNSSYTKVE